MRPCPIIFDLDGTLIDSAPDIHAALNRALTAHNFEPLTLKEVRSYIGRGVPHLLACAFTRQAQPEPAGFRADFEEIYAQAVNLTRVFAGVRETLDALIAAGHPLGICTNKPLRATEAILNHLSLHDKFKTIIGGDSLPVRKPDPAPLIKALWDLGDGGALYIGDSEVDAQTAKAAKLPFVLYTEGYRSAAPQALDTAAIFSNYADLPALITRLTTEIFRSTA